MPELRLSRPLRLFAPAKVNLGLEVLRRRDDGYHEIVTVLQAVSLFDEIVLTPASHYEFRGDPRVEPEADLANRAVRGFERHTGLELRARVRVRKRIPIAAGLGGGSSDAGTLLGALGALARVSDADCRELAAALGSDVPFFLRGGTALASGTGTEIEDLPPLARAWFVIVTPPVHLRDKTATLYASLREEDFSAGQDTARVVEQIRGGDRIRPENLRNAFACVLYVEPSIDAIRQALLDSSVPFALPDGAGPSLFTMVDSWDYANRLEAELRTRGIDAVACTNLSPGLNQARIVAARQQ